MMVLHNMGYQGSSDERCRIWMDRTRRENDAEPVIKQWFLPVLKQWLSSDYLETT